MKKNKVITIGTRGSRLSLAQVEHVKDELLLAYPNLDPELIQIKSIKTSGDKFQNKQLSELGGKVLFCKEIEEELLDEKIDLAVHSLKDVPTILPKGLNITCVLKRSDPRDALIARTANTFFDLSKGSVIGTSSARRKSQILNLRPDLEIVPFRGNIHTRIEKLKEGNVDGIVLAYAGLRRLGYHNDVSYIFDVDEIIPAASQGVICIETRENDHELQAMISSINDRETFLTSEAERSVLNVLDASCTSAIGCFASISNKRLLVRAQLLSPDGSISFKQEKSGFASDAKKIGTTLGIELKNEVGDNFFRDNTSAYTSHATH